MFLHALTLVIFKAAFICNYHGRLVVDSTHTHIFFLWRTLTDITISLLFNFDVQKRVLRNMPERPNMDHFKANFKHIAMSTTRLQPSTHLVGPRTSTWLEFGHQVPALNIFYYDNDRMGEHVLVGITESFYVNMFPDGNLSTSFS